jgi:hypothetical protein
MFDMYTAVPVEKRSICHMTFFVVFTSPEVNTLAGTGAIILSWPKFKNLFIAMSACKISDELYSVIMRQVRLMIILIIFSTIPFVIILVGIRAVLSETWKHSILQIVITKIGYVPPIIALSSWIITDTMLVIILGSISKAMKSLNTEIEQGLITTNISQLDSIRRRYCQLCHLIPLVSDAYGKYILSVSVSCGLELTIVMFMFFATSSEASSHGDWIYTVGLVMTALTVWPRLGILCYSAEGPPNQVVLAQKMLTMHPDEGNTDLDSMIKRFQSDLEINKPILTAFSFFPVSRSVALSVIGQVGTYLVILIQFYPTTDKNNSVDYGITKCLAYYY